MASTATEASTSVIMSTRLSSSTSTTLSNLRNDYPWIHLPLIVSAPMGGFATAPLATAVSLSGGIGFIGAVTDMVALDNALIAAQHKLEDAGLMVNEGQTATMPIGVGFLPFALEMGKALDVVKKHRPRIVWLSFAKEMSDFTVWSRAIREASPASKIWIMLGTVSTALEVVPNAMPDVLVMQGADAGGHGLEKSAGVIAIVPETIDALENAGYEHVPVLAAGGIVDGRGVAAALSLGAQGVVMGTRFLASRECVVPHPMYREVVIRAKDGAKATVRSKVFDELRGPNFWPEAYDGRAIRNESWQDMKDGIDVAEIRKRYAEAANEDDGGYALYGDGMKGRTMVWAGAGVGLVNEIQDAGKIVEEVRLGAKKALDRVNANI